MKSSGVFLFLMFSAFYGFSQESKSKVLNGQVTSDGKDVTGVVVKNISTQNAVITDFDGNFSIPVRENDTLIFLAIQFQNKILPISESIYNTKFVTVTLEEFVNELDEVVVRPYNLSGTLGEDLKTLKLEKDVSAEALGLPNAEVRIITQSERKLFEADSGKFFYFYVVAASINVNKILNRLSGRTKKLKKRVAIDKKYAETQSVQESIVDSLFINALKIPEGRIDDFMYFCEVDTDFQNVVTTEDQLKIWSFMTQKSMDYRKNNGLE